MLPLAAARALLVVILLPGCAGYRLTLQQVEQQLTQGNPEQALAMLEGGGLGSRDDVLYLLHKGTLLRYAGDYAGSADAFERAKRLMGGLEALSVSETAGTLAISENLASYTGRLYERLLVHVYQALNHLALDDPGAARVEALQTDLILRRLYPGTERAPNGGDAFARYLSGLIFEANDEPDDALIAYRRALEAYAESREAYGVGVPDDLKQRLVRLTAENGLDEESAAYRGAFGLDEWQPPEESGELIVLLHAGLAPRKLEHSVLSQDPASGRMFRISLPVLQERPPAVRRMRIAADGRQAGSEKVEDVAQAARRTLEDELPGLTARAIARMVVKNAAANQASERDQAFGALVNFIGVIVEQADTRSWSILPDSIYLASLPLPQGKHDVAVELYDNYGGVAATRHYLGVEIAPGGKAFISVHWAR